MKIVNIFSLLLLLVPISLFSQDSKKSTYKNFPVQSITDERFDVKHVTFNKIFEPAGKGEILKVAFEITNKVDEQMDFYVFVIATFEKVERARTSFQSPMREKAIIRNFIPFPNDIKNFEYSADGSKTAGKKVKFEKYPKNVKAGINPVTGKFYHLSDSLIVRTNHLSRYRARYVFFNMITILIFDEKKLKDTQGIHKPVFRQVYLIKGKRQ